MSAVTLTLQTKDCKLIEPHPSPTWGVSDVRGTGMGSHAFHPRIRCPWGLWNPLVCPQRLQDRTRWVGECGLGARETSFSPTTSSFLTCGRCDFRLVPEVAKPQPVLGTAASLSLPRTASSHGPGLHLGLLALRLRCDPGAKATFLRALLRREAIRCLMGLEHRCIPLAVTITG